MRIIKKDVEQVSYDGHTFDGKDGVFDVPDDAARVLVNVHGFQYALGTPINLDKLAAEAQAQVDAAKPKPAPRKTPAKTAAADQK